MRKNRKLIVFMLILEFFFSIHIINSKDFKTNSKMSKIKILDEDDIFGEFTVISPNSLDVLRMGENFTIKWNFMGDVKYVSIALYKSMEYIDSIAITAKNDGEYKWSVGQYEEGIDYSIRIWDYNNYLTGDFSDYFQITANSGSYFEPIISLFLIIGISVGIVFVIIIFLKKEIFS